jgi:hypothetical protein
VVQYVVVKRDVMWSNVIQWCVMSHDITRSAVRSIMRWSTVQYS